MPTYNTFPTLQGLGWDLKKRLITSTDIETSSSGAEYRLARWPGLPHFEFDLSVPYLSQADKATLEAFFIGQNGPGTPFLLGSVNNDNGLTGANCGSGTGASATVQIPLPAQAQVTSTTTVTANGTALPAAGCPTPSAPTLGQTAGGAKAARTYYARVTYVDVAGGETPASAEASLAVAANSLLTVASPPATQGAASWRLYLNTAASTEKLIATTAVGTGYTEPTSALSFTGAAYPTADTSGWAVSASGQITFQANISAGVAIAWTGAYAYLVRFLEDTLEFNQFANTMYEVDTITMRTVR